MPFDINDDLLVELVREDLIEGFAAPDAELGRPDRGTSLPPLGEPMDSVQVVQEFGTLRGTDHGAVVWRYSGLNSVRFLGLHPTGREIIVDGITLVSGNADEPSFHRLIDWHAVYAQLGVANGGRPVSALPDDYDPDAPIDGIIS
jgi:hypothetical protein